MAVSNIQNSERNVFTTDPTQVFIPGTVLSDDDEFGTLISATVVREFVPQIGFSSVSIRILPIGTYHASKLRKAVSRVSNNVRSTVLLKYVGVWVVSSNETWLVSERRHHVTVKTLLEQVQCADIESLIAFVVNRTLQSLTVLHEECQSAHMNIRPGNIYLCDDGSVCFGDAGIYQALYDALSHRRSFPGAKLWLAPTTSNDSIQAFRSDIWDLGIALLVLVDGGASVARLWRSGHRIPRLCNPARWSVQFNNFLFYAFGGEDNQQVPSCTELLKHRFVSGATSTTCRSAMKEYWMKRDELITAQYKPDTISSLFRQNNAAVLVPLISIDDISTDHFSYEEWKSSHQMRPTTEMSLFRVLKTCKEQPLRRDTEENNKVSRTIAALETYFETVDII